MKNSQTKAKLPPPPFNKRKLKSTSFRKIKYSRKQREADGSWDEAVRRLGSDVAGLKYAGSKISSGRLSQLN